MSYAIATSAVNNNAAQAVVLNETQTDAQVAVQGLTAGRNSIEQLVLDAEAWQNTAFKSSNEQLYGLLARCYSLYQAMSGDTDQAKALRDGLNTYINTKGYVFGKGTHTINKIVKCVFGFDRRRVSAYGIVLRTALANKVLAAQVPAFIRDNGGVEEIRLAKSPNAMTPKQKAGIAASTVVVNDLGVVSSHALSAKLDAGKIGTNTVLIGTWQADGSVVIRAVVESDTALNAALASHYAKNQADIAADKKRREEEAIAKAKADAAKEAAESATVNL